MRVQSGNCLSWHSVSLNHYLLQHDIRERQCWILDGDDIRFGGAIPYDVEPVAVAMAVCLYPLIGGQFYKFAFASTRFNFDASYLSRVRISTANVEATPVMVLTDIFWLSPL